MALPTSPGTNCWTKAEDMIADTIAGLSSVQLFLGEGSKAAAKAGNMFMDSIGRAPEYFTEAEWVAKFPNILIGSPGDDASVFTLEPRSSGFDYGATGVIEVHFATMLVDDDRETEQEREFKNHVGDILQELTDQPLDVSSITVEAYGRNGEEDHERMGVILSALIKIEWGFVGGSE
jgi:hypothetical protein